MPGRRELDRDAWRHFDRPLVSERLQVGERTSCVSLCVQRQRRAMFRVAVLVGLPRVFFLDAAGIRQYQPAQVGRTAGAEDAPAEALRDEPRQVADVIEMRMRQDDGVDRVRRHRTILPVSEPEILQPLEQSAVDKDAVPPVIEEIFRPGDGARRAEKRQFSHGVTIAGLGARAAILSPWFQLLASRPACVWSPRRSA